MCMQDWRIGRLIRSVSQTFTAGAIGGTTIANSQQRVGITIAIADLNGAAALEFIIVNVDAIPLCVLTPEQPFRHFTIVEHGDLPTRRFTFTNGSLTQPVSVVQYFAPEEFLTEAIEQFKRQYIPGGQGSKWEK